MALASRVRQLVQRFHDGSINAAAADTGVSQPTLSRIASGTVKNPRRAALERIAAFYGVSVDWLLRGEGKGPNEVVNAFPLVRPTAAWLRWTRLVTDLGLPDPLEKAMLDLPAGVSYAPLILPMWDEKQQPMVWWNGKDMEAAMALHVSAWHTFFASMIERSGRDAVRELLLAGADRVLLGFHPFSIHLLKMGRLPANLLNLYENEFPGVASLFTERSETTVRERTPHRGRLRDDRNMYETLNDRRKRASKQRRKRA